MTVKVRVTYIAVSLWLNKLRFYAVTLAAPRKRGGTPNTYHSHKWPDSLNTHTHTHPIFVLFFPSFRCCVQWHATVILIEDKFVNQKPKLIDSMSRNSVLRNVLARNTSASRNRQLFGCYGSWAAQQRYFATSAAAAKHHVFSSPRENQFKSHSRTTIRHRHSEAMKLIECFDIKFHYSYTYPSRIPCSHYYRIYEF